MMGHQICRENKVQELNIEVTDCRGQSYDGASNMLENKVQQLNIEVTDCRGQSFDGASNMSSKQVART